MRNTTISTLLFVLLSMGCFAQQRLGILVETQTNVDQLIMDLFPQENTSIKHTRLSKVMPYYLVEFPLDIKESEALQYLQRSEMVQHAALNRKVQNRQVPNDNLYSEQLALEIIKAEEAWNITTGGLTSDNKEIVVAVIDDGFDISHQDLVDNLWSNPGEIPDDGEDNDGNGIIDDVFGFNSSLNSDEHDMLNHGTNVFGIIGAKGDNSIGVSGVNWDVKIMTISTNGTIAQIIQAYDYARAQRQKFNDTNGTEGAFVVASNSSFGIDNEFGTSFPMWCNMYNSMGDTGILSVVATSNNVKDIDALGDMPSTCDSKFVIAVTNVDVTLALEGAFGATNIDLGAPGEECYSTRLQNAYGAFSGTSAACPLVSGAIALMYSVNSPLFNEDLSPPELACELKNIVLNTVQNSNALDSISVSGGILNLEAALSELVDCPQIETDPKAISICKLSPNPTNASLSFSVASQNIGEFDLMIFDSLGKLISSTKISNLVQSEWSVDVSALLQGSYILHVENNQSSTSTKFIKY